MKISRRRLPSIEKIAAGIGIVATLIGGGWTLWTYFGDAKAARIQRVEALVEQLHSKPLTDDVDVVDHAMDRAIKTNWGSDGSPPSLVVINGDSAVRTAIDHLGLFFDSVAKCASDQPVLCDPVYAKQELRDEANDFLGFVHWYYCDQRKRWHSTTPTPAEVFFRDDNGCERHRKV